MTSGMATRHGNRSAANIKQGDDGDGGTGSSGSGGPSPRTQTKSAAVLVLGRRLAVVASAVLRLLLLALAHLAAALLARLEPVAQALQMRLAVLHGARVRLLDLGERVGDGDEPWRDVTAAGPRRLRLASARTWAARSSLRFSLALASASLLALLTSPAMRSLMRFS